MTTTGEQRFEIVTVERNDGYEVSGGSLASAMFGAQLERAAVSAESQRRVLWLAMIGDWLDLKESKSKEPHAAELSGGDRAVAGVSGDAVCGGFRAGAHVRAVGGSPRACARLAVGAAGRRVERVDGKSSVELCEQFLQFCDQ